MRTVAGRKALGLVGLIALAAATGCTGASLVAARAAQDLSCPEKDIQVTSREMGAYDAKGCGRSMSYLVRAGEVMTDSGGDLAPNPHGE
jgi:hypothetical protein